MPNRKRTRKPTDYWRRIVAMLRRLWWWSPQRKAVLVRDNHKCCACGAKDKLNVHHLDGINWERIRKVLFEELFCGPDKLITLCSDCHRVQEPHDFAHDGTCKAATRENGVCASGTRRKLTKG